MFYGTSGQVAAALEAAAPFKEELLRRGVFLVPLPLKDGDASADLAPLDKDDKESAKCAAPPRAAARPCMCAYVPVCWYQCARWAARSCMPRDRRSGSSEAAPIKDANSK